MRLPGSVLLVARADRGLDRDHTLAPRPPGPLFDSARTPESTRAAIGQTKQSKVLWRVELTAGGATALTRAMVYRGESFNRAAVLLKSTPQPSSLPREWELVATETPPSKGGVRKGRGRSFVAGLVTRSAPNGSGDLRPTSTLGDDAIAVGRFGDVAQHFLVRDGIARKERVGTGSARADSRGPRPGGAFRVGRPCAPEELWTGLRRRTSRSGN